MFKKPQNNQKTNYHNAGVDAKQAAGCFPMDVTSV